MWCLLLHPCATGCGEGQPQCLSSFLLLFRLPPQGIHPFFHCHCSLGLWLWLWSLLPSLAWTPPVAPCFPQPGPQSLAKRAGASVWGHLCLPHVTLGTEEITMFWAHLLISDPCRLLHSLSKKAPSILGSLNFRADHEHPELRKASSPSPFSSGGTGRLSAQELVTRDCWANACAAEGTHHDPAKSAQQSHAEEGKGGGLGGGSCKPQPAGLVSEVLGCHPTCVTAIVATKGQNWDVTPDASQPSPGSLCFCQSLCPRALGSFRHSLSSPFPFGGQKNLLSPPTASLGVLRARVPARQPRGSFGLWPLCQGF